MLEPQMPPALRFIFAARRMELQGLEDLTKTCELVSLIGDLIHVLQRERTHTNLYLSNLTEPNLTYLNHLSDEVTEVEVEVRKRFDTLDLPSTSSAERARCFNRIAHVLHGFAELPGVRTRIRQQGLSATDATAFFTCMIERLLAVIFEAADTAVDSDIARVLGATCNFLHGKELALQERACGVGGFAHGFFDDARRDYLEQLVHRQARYFEIFLDFADEWANQLWFDVATSNFNAQQAKMRAMALRASQTNRMVDLSEVWFDVCTARIDSFRYVAGHLSRMLKSSCELAINQLSAELQAMARKGRAPTDGLPVLGMLQAQTQRLACASKQLGVARAMLNERRVVERAQQVLMAHDQLSDSQAYLKLHKTALEVGEPLLKVAQGLIDLHARRG